MKKSVLVYLFAVLLFLFGISLTADAGLIGVWYIYLAVLLIPSGAAVFAFFLFGEKGEPPRFLPTKKTAKRTALCFFPSLSVCLAASLLTVGFFALFGVEKPPQELEGGLFRQIFYYAVLPAVGEELLFRYLPLRFLLPYGNLTALFLSATVFALVHADKFAFLYAFLAGVIFFLADMEENSLFPSVIFHFGINLFSVFFYPYEGMLVPSLLYFAGALCLGTVCLFVLRKTDASFLPALKNAVFNNQTMQTRDYDNR